MTLVPLGIFAHVHEHNVGILVQPGAGLFHGDFAYALLGFGHKFKKTG